MEAQDNKPENVNILLFRRTNTVMIVQGFQGKAW